MLAMKNRMDEIKQNTDSLNSRADNIEEQISTIGDRNTEMLQKEEARVLRIKRNELSLREISNSFRKCNIRITGVPEEDEKENGAESVFKEIIAGNFPNVGEELEIHVKEANKSPNYINVKRPAARHIEVKLAKANDKEKILRAARWKKVTYKGTPIRLSVGFSAETLQAWRDWNDTLKSLKDKNFQPRILYPVKISFRYDREIKTCPNKQKLREFIATRSALPPPTTRIRILS
uniref:L1 transposable element RRM domain-containing protein n=1 Tax=Equus caballus TaxID=9796 RepID=A0A9L0RK37_HORSE